MPKIKDLGIKVIPEQMRPAECANFTVCACTAVSPCGVGGSLQPCGFHTGCVLHTTLTVCFNCTFKITQIPCLCTHLASIPCAGGTCGISEIPWGQGELTIEQVRVLREQMQSQLTALDDYAKTIGPKTAEEIDAREKALNEELADLKARRKNIGK